MKLVSKLAACATLATALLGGCSSMMSGDKAPAMMSGGMLVGPKGMTLYTFDRDDGKKQWAMKGKPLYYWAKDTKAGDMTGDGVANNSWHVIK